MNKVKKLISYPGTQTLLWTALILITWEVLSRAGVINSYLLPSCSDVMVKLYEEIVSGNFLLQIWNSVIIHNHIIKINLHNYLLHNHRQIYAQHNIQDRLKLSTVYPLKVKKTHNTHKTHLKLIVHITTKINTTSITPTPSSSKKRLRISSRFSILSPPFPGSHIFRLARTLT